MCAPPVEKLVVVVATPFASATGLSAVPSIVNVTVPVGAVVPEVWATVAVTLTVTPVAEAKERQRSWSSFRPLKQRK